MLGALRIVLDPGSRSWGGGSLGARGTWEELVSVLVHTGDSIGPLKPSDHRLKVSDLCKVPRLGRSLPSPHGQDR